MERRGVPGDRRVYGIYLVDNGKEAWAALRDKVRQSDAARTRNLTPEEVDQMRALLAKIRQ